MSHRETSPQHHPTRPTGQGTLYAKALQDYRRERQHANNNRERDPLLQDQAARLTATFDTLRTTLPAQTDAPPCPHPPLLGTPQHIPTSESG